MISTHILDTSRGAPAAEVEVRLEKKTGEDWKVLETAKTNPDGRISFTSPAAAGDYRLQFEVEGYFFRLGQVPFFIAAPVVFRVTDIGRKYHVPLLLNPYGYSTYRGS